MPRAAPTTNDPKRILMIRCKVCQRLVKELQHYQTELAANETMVQDMKTAGKNVYDIKYYQQVLNESRIMVPDAHRRLALALEELAQEVVDPPMGSTSPGTANNDDDENDNEWKTTAQMLLKEHAATFKRHDVLLTNLEGLDEGEAF